MAVVILAMIIVFFVGKSFSFFSYRKEGSVTNIVTFRGLEVNVLASGANSLNLTSAYPVYDSQGLSGTPFEFTVKNATTDSINYTLSIENDTEKQQACTVNDTTCPALEASYIRYAYSIDDGSYSTPANLGSNNQIVFTDQITSNETNKISILLWIDQDAPNSVQGKYFFGKIVLTGAKVSQ